jgi:hypothetical protein
VRQILPIKAGVSGPKNEGVTPRVGPHDLAGCFSTMLALMIAQNHTQQRAISGAADD